MSEDNLNDASALLSLQQQQQQQQQQQHEYQDVTIRYLFSHTDIDYSHG